MVDEVIDQVTEQQRYPSQAPFLKTFLTPPHSIFFLKSFNYHHLHPSANAHRRDEFNEGRSDVKTC